MERLETESESALKALLVLRTDSALSAGSGANLNRKNINGFTAGYSANDEIESGQTNYYKATIKYPPMSEGEFFIEAFGRDKDTECPIGHSVSCGFFAYGHLDPWYSSNWKYKRKIIIDSSRVATTTDAFPVLATSTLADLKTTANGGKVGNDNGYDIVFVDDDDSTVLNYEREKYASTTGEIVYWIKTDISSTTDKTIYMYYGKSGASDLATTTGVWDDNFVMVQHMEENPAGGATPDGADEIFDSTSNSNDGNTGGTMLTGDQVAGQFDGSVDFDGGDDYVDCGDISNSAKSVSFWIKTNSLTEDIMNLYVDSCGDNLAISHTAGVVAPVTKAVTYGTVNTNLSGSDKCWITQNLGADNQASSPSDSTEASAGWYWQFNHMQGSYAKYSMDYSN